MRKRERKKERESERKKKKQRRRFNGCLGRESNEEKERE